MTQTVRFQATDSVGSIVAAFPGASNVFKAHRIDFCCGGQQPVSEAVKTTSISVEALLQQLQEAYERTEERGRQCHWSEMSSTQLIEYIVATHHGYLRSELPLLGEFVDKIARVHGPSHPELLELRQHYHSLRRELEEHIHSEEEQVFSLIAEWETSGSAIAADRARQAIQELEAEHQEAGDLLRAMRELTCDYTLPEGACRTYTVAFQKLEQLESDLFQHIHLENNILFQAL